MRTQAIHTIFAKIKWENSKKFSRVHDLQFLIRGFVIVFENPDF